MQKYMTLEDIYNDLADLKDKTRKLKLSIDWDEDEAPGEYDVNVTAYDILGTIVYDNTYATYDTHADAVNAVDLISEKFPDFDVE